MALIDKVMNSTTLARAKLHVYNVCQSGKSITLVKKGSADEFGEILTESTDTFKSHPVRYSPFERKVAQDISWTEDVDVIAYISVKELDDSSLTVESLRRYKKLRVDGKDFEIKHVEYMSAFFDSFLYVVIGGKR